MAAPQFVAVGTPDGGGGSVTPGLPGGMSHGVSHMYLLASTARQELDPIDGWEVLGTIDNGGATPGAHGAIQLTVLHRVYQAGDVAPTIPDPGSYCMAQIAAFDGVGSHNAMVIGQSPEGQNDRTVTPITTTVDDCTILVMIGNDRDQETSDSQLRPEIDAPDFDDAAVEIIDVGTSSGTGGQIAAFYGTKSAAGLVDGIIFRLGSNATYDCVHMVLALAPDTAPAPNRRAPRSFSFL